MNEWVQSLWSTYAAMAPNVSEIPAFLWEQGELIENDHVAFRTFDLAPINLVALEPVLESMGYRESGRYEFEAKKLFARSYSHPEGPRVFLSELRTDLLSDWASGFIRELVDGATVNLDPSIFFAGPLWGQVSYSDYQRLLEETEYGGWVAAMGLVPNHFTISVNALQRYDLPQLLDHVEELGFSLNLAGGRIKGSSTKLLAQASTLADRIEIDFQEGPREVPTCYYEFAARYLQPDGRLFDGFIVGSADKIFESTKSR